MNQIRILDAKISNMIAAGEVIERPAAVVKELLENSIDANGSRIEVHIRDGGTSYIEVVDNGSGMNKADALLALERHATSKIKSEGDLWNIKTLGFRGEALPSIASVSDVRIETCDGTESTLIEVSSGEVKKVTAGVFRQGTQIKVERLFYALPARLKHLKSIPYEFSLILDIVQKLALLHANIAFLVTHDDKEVFRTTGNGDGLAILYAIYGRDVAKAAVAIEAENDDFQIRGYICLPHQSRSNRYHIVTFMNERLIKSFKLQQAVVDGYADYIAEKRYPMAFLMVTLDGKLIDVNVHPSKWEVRLSKEQQLCSLIATCVAQTLQHHLQKSPSLLSDEKSKRIDGLGWDGSQSQPLQQPTKIAEDGSSIKVSHSPWQSQGTEPDLPIKKSMQLQWPSRAFRQDVGYLKEVVGLPTAVDSGVFNNVPLENGENTGYFGDNSSIIVEKLAETVENYGLMVDYDIIGQLHGSYILCQDQDGLLIVDQHAANERIRYEEVRNLLLAKEIQTQPLLLPLVLEVGQQTMMRLSEITVHLEDIGIHLEVFGEHALLCREIPLWMQENDEKQFLLDLIERMLEHRKKGIAELNKDALATLACHTSVRFNRVLRMEEMQTLLQRLLSCENPYHCPHGRPTMVHYEASKLKKLFDR